MFLIAPGFYTDKEKFDLTVLLCRITMPYLVFISVTALFGGVLNSVGRFAAFAFSPVVLSLVVIIGTLILNNYYFPAISISLSVLIAGFLQVTFMYYCIKQAKLTFYLRLKTNDKDVIKFLKNMGPATLTAGAGQVGLFISQSIASFIPGAVSILSYADRIYQFPLSIIGISFSTILLPELSRIYKAKDLLQAHKVQNKAIKIALLLSLPAACGIMILSDPIIHIIYERGAFTRIDTIKTSQAISAFALGLPAFILAKILTPMFYANGDTKTPLKITIYTLIMNTALNIILMYFLSHTGIALGTSIAAWFNIYLLYKYAKKNYNLHIDLSVINFTIKIIISCTIMSLIIFLIQHYGLYYFYSKSSIFKILTLGGTVLIGGVCFMIMNLYFGLHKILLSK
jgi:putative peptidoglycan lipid II flippase